MNTEQFIQKATEIHGGKYDYSKVEYKKIREKVIIICKEHGEFLQSIELHIYRKCGCKKCADILRGQNRKITTKQFIERAIKIHGDRYDYSKSKYTGIYDKVCIICKIHGDFYQIPNYHINKGCGCQLCYDDRRGESIRSNTQQFIEKAIQIHGDRYDYSKSNYISIDDEITIICKIHGEFSQVSYSHITGKGCKKCGIIRRANIRKSNTDDFVKKAIKIHGVKYDYSKSEYINSNTKIIIICKKHGEFLQQPNNHINSGYGCVFCLNKTEGKLCKRLKLTYPSLITQFKQDWCKKIRYLPFDFCIPEHKIIIELDGRQHFQQVRNWSSPEEQQDNDKFKEKCANENGYSVIRLLQEDVYDDSYNWLKELIESIEEIIYSKSVKNKYLCKNDEYLNYSVREMDA